MTGRGGQLLQLKRDGEFCCFFSRLGVRFVVSPGSPVRPRLVPRQPAAGSPLRSRGVRWVRVRRVRLHSARRAIRVRGKCSAALTRVSATSDPARSEPPAPGSSGASHSASPGDRRSSTQTASPVPARSIATASCPAPSLIALFVGAGFSFASSSESSMVKRASLSALSHLSEDISPFAADERAGRQFALGRNAPPAFPTSAGRSSAPGRSCERSRAPARRPAT